jgi:hypothetical protein
MNEPLVVTITLIAIPGAWQAPAIVRLRRLLKAALRGYGFRCTDCRPVTPTNNQAKGSDAL